MSGSKLNKQLWTDINRLKLLNKVDSEPRFILDESPFKEDDDEEEELAASANTKQLIVVGRIFPKSDIYREGVFQIEMKLTQEFPVDPPEVRFITPIYHPNVKKDGTFCNELLQKYSRWTRTTSLVDVVRIVVKHIDEPNIEYATSLAMGREYMENKSQFDRTAREYIERHALPRTRA